MDTDERDEFIRLSLAMGMGYKDIVRALAVELGVNISLRHLKRTTEHDGIILQKTLY